MMFITNHSDERGVSDTLGYILLVSVVFLSVGIVFVMGGGMIDSQQEAEYFSNTVNAFEVMSENLNAIERDRAPSRETELRYHGGQLFQAEQTRLELEVYNPDTGEHYTTDSLTYSNTPVTYVKGDSSVHYEHGAIIRTDTGSSLMVDHPSYSFGEEQTRISHISTSVVEDQHTLTGSGKIAVVARESSSGTEAITTSTDPDNPVQVTVTVHSPRYDVWGGYFEEEGLEKVEMNSVEEKAEFRYETQEFYLRHTQIRIDARR